MQCIIKDFKSWLHVNTYSHNPLNSEVTIDLWLWLEFSEYLLRHLAREYDGNSEHHPIKKIHVNYVHYTTSSEVLLLVVHCIYHVGRLFLIVLFFPQICSEKSWKWLLGRWFVPPLIHLFVSRIKFSSSSSSKFSMYYLEIIISKLLTQINK